MAAIVTRIHTAAPRTLRGSAEAFLDTIGAGNTRRAYGIAVVKTVDQLDGRDPDGLPGPSRALDSVSDDEIGAALETLWGPALNTWNARRAAVAKCGTTPAQRIRPRPARASRPHARRARTAPSSTPHPASAPPARHRACVPD